MKRFLFCVIALAGGMGSADAAPFCASPGELKLLKAAVLEQALSAAAQSCRLDGEFSRFVTAYHQGMVESDRALQAFFAQHRTGENYQAYKARIAATLAQKSLHDPAFCREAQRVFAIALKREKAAPPRLIPTGYEDCGSPARLQAAALSLNPAHRASPPTPILPPEAEKALALAPHAMQARATPPTPIPSLRPSVKFAGQKPPVTPKLATAKPDKVMPGSFRWTELPQGPVASTSASHLAKAGLPRGMMEEGASTDPVPNAYRHGAYWVVRDGSSTEERRSSPYMFQGPDGHWIVVTRRDGADE